MPYLRFNSWVCVKGCINIMTAIDPHKNHWLEIQIDEMIVVCVFQDIQARVESYSFKCSSTNWQ